MDFIERNISKNQTPVGLSSGGGIFASVEELISQRKFTKYVNYSNNKKAYSAMSGDAKSIFRGRGIEFEEIRAYEFGDEVRDIDWRVTARKSAPYTKIYNEERNHEVYAFIDLSPSMLFGTKMEFKSVLASKIAALIAWVCLENNDKFGCCLFDGYETYVIKPKNFRDHTLAILKKISEVSQKAIEQPDAQRKVKEFNRAVLEFQSALKVRSTIFVISDFSNFDDKVMKNFSTLAYKNDLVFVGVFDKIEETFSQQGEYMIGYKDDRIVFDVGNSSFKEKYEKIFVHKSEEIIDFCHKVSCRYFQVTTGVSAYKQIRI